MTLKIFGKKIRVLKTKNMANDINARALFVPDKDLILIDSEQVGKQYWQSLVHELVHSVIYRTGIDQAQIDSGVEEIICENVATAIIENFKLTKI